MSDLERKEASFVGALEAYENYSVLKMELEKKMKKGHMELAQARYAMGVDRVGSLRYPPEMEASVRVERGIDGFVLNTREGGPAAKLLKSGNHGNVKVCEQGVCTNDPLKWFGGMVSPHLRAAQASFTKVLPLILQVVDAVKEVNEHVSSYEAAAAVKPGPEVEAGACTPVFSS